MTTIILLTAASAFFAVKAERRGERKFRAGMPDIITGTICGVFFGGFLDAFFVTTTDHAALMLPICEASFFGALLGILTFPKKPRETMSALEPAQLGVQNTAATLSNASDQPSPNQSSTAQATTKGQVWRNVIGLFAGLAIVALLTSLLQPSSGSRKHQTNRDQRAYQSSNDLASTPAPVIPSEPPRVEAPAPQVPSQAVAFTDMETASSEQLFQLAANDNREAQFALGMRYLRGDRVTKNETAAFNWFFNAASRGHVEAQGFIGWMFNDGVGVSQSHSEAFEWYMKASKAGDSNAQCALGQMYIEGRFVSKDPVQGVRWLLSSAELGNPMGQYNIGMCYYKGDGVNKDHAEAFKWIKKAALQGDAESQFCVGLMYVGGDGVRQDFIESYGWFSAAMKSGHPEAQEKVRAFEANAPSLLSQAMANARMIQGAIKPGSGLQLKPQR